MHRMLKRIILVIVVLAILPVALYSPAGNAREQALSTSQPGILTADGGDPVPIPWHKVAAVPSSEPSVLIADGGDPVPIPWHKVAAVPSSEPSVLIADGGDPVPIPWHKVAVA